MPAWFFVHRREWKVGVFLGGGVGSGDREGKGLLLMTTRHVLIVTNDCSGCCGDL